jgi:hypothetical protein
LDFNWYFHSFLYLVLSPIPASFTITENNEGELTNLLREAKGAVILDSGCPSLVTGKLWLSQFLEIWNRKKKESSGLAVMQFSDLGPALGLDQLVWSPSRAQ